ncbi:MAG TPA: hypothetical protein VE988_11880 [Gemmataceae bacterium]|nr:hypothetical protein [Gemmataceae bacterium]
MNLTLLDKLVNAVLYEGYILYPYRPSVKNRQRWTFGGLYPRAYSEAQTGSDAWAMQTECVVQGDEQSALEVRVRFLHLVNRLVGQFQQPRQQLSEGVEPPYRLVDSLQVGERLAQTWQEAVEREVAADKLQLESLLRQPWRGDFTFAGGRRCEPLEYPESGIVGMFVREQETINGLLEVAAERAEGNLFKVRVRIENCTELPRSTENSRDNALMRCLVSTHTILNMTGGEFVSSLDPPPQAQDLVATCQNMGAWPVLVGANGERDTLLSSPIILYDYPQIAAESPGELFDNTEIDEILSLRILTLTDEEKRTAAALDDRVRSLLVRTEALDRGQMLGLHGTVRGLRPVPQGELS